MKRLKSSLGRVAAGLFIFALFFAGLSFILNKTAEKLLKQNETGYARHQMAAYFGDSSHYLSCHEWEDNWHFDFFLSDVIDEYEWFSNVGLASIDTENPVRCVRHEIDPISKFRPLDVPVNKPNGEKRVVFIGDSFTYGESVPEGTAYPDAINSYLWLLGNPEGWRAINFGIAGTDMPFIYEHIFKKALESDPDTIVYAWTPTDTTYKAAMHKSMRINNLIVIDSGAMRSDAPAFTRLTRLLLLNRRLTAQAIKAYTDLNSPANKDGIKQFRKILSSMKAESEAAGIDFHLALFPLITGKPGRYPLHSARRFIQDMAENESISCFDLTESVIQEPTKNLWVSPSNRHPNVQAHRLAAKAFMKKLAIPTSLPLEGVPDIGDPAANKNMAANPVFGSGNECLAADSFDPPLSENAARALRAEINSLYPAGATIITNSASTLKAINNESRHTILPAKKNSPPEVLCRDDSPCIYLLFIPAKAKNTFSLSTFEAPYLSRMTFHEGMVLFMIPEIVSFFPEKVVIHAEDICRPD